MTRSRPVASNACVRTLSLALFLAPALAQQCYYPNGNPADKAEKPCSSQDGAACCPNTWECQDNGLCYNPAAKIYGRYSCTDKTWGSPHCPSNLCTYGKSAAGAEAIVQCSSHDNQWCCDANRVDVDCCNEKPEPRPFFDLAQGQAYMTIGQGSPPSSAPTLASITGYALASEVPGGGGGSKSSVAASSQGPKSSSDPKTSDASADAKPSTTVNTGSTPVTAVQTSFSSGSAGVVTVVRTSILQPAETSVSTPAPSPEPVAKKSKLPVIVGCAVGIPFGLALVGILFWLFRKRRQQKSHKNPYDTPDPYTNGTSHGGNTPEFMGGAKLHKPNGNGNYKSEADMSQVPELAGQGVGPGRPISTIKGHAELPGGAGFAPGVVPHAPHLVGVGGGNGVNHTPQSSWGSAPPGYSPGMNQQAWAPGAAPAGAGMGPAELPTGPTTPPEVPQQQGQLHTDGGRYIPYRPSQSHGQGLQNVQEVNELSAVKTPPA